MIIPRSQPPIPLLAGTISLLLAQGPSGADSSKGIQGKAVPRPLSVHAEPSQSRFSIWALGRDTPRDQPALSSPSPVTLQMGLDEAFRPAAKSEGDK